MNNTQPIYRFIYTSALISCFLSAMAQPDTVRYVGQTLSNVDYHHGQLRPALGVHNIQVMRVNRYDPTPANGYGWTYNHAPLLAYWNDTFYLEYLSDSVGEHIPPGHTLLVTSPDGYQWSEPVVLFPRYKVPDGTTKEENTGVAKDLYAVMHQRMGFYLADNDRMLALAYYGIALDDHDSPNDGHGIGRVVREIYADGSFGPIHFIRYNEGWREENTDYPFYRSSNDKEFVQACDELLSKPLMMQQWVEEADRDDPLIPLPEQYKAFSYYHLPDGRVVGLWKHALTSISEDGGESWLYPPVRAPHFVNSNAKIWGQRTSDGNYATVYNPSEFRWPLAISVSKNGLDYDSLLLVQGEITSMRYGGNYKSYGPQYVRGILEGNGTPPDGKLWVTYSMNKEDIWVASIPVPVKAQAEQPVDEVFAQMPDGEELSQWNIYSPQWASVGIEKMDDGTKVLALQDSDRFDYAKAERLFPPAQQVSCAFTIIPAQNNQGLMHIEFQDGKGTAAARLILDADSTLKVKAGYRLSTLTSYKPNQPLDVRVELNTDTRSYEVFIDGNKETTRIFFAPVHTLERVVFRTGEVRRFPDADTPTDQMFDLPKAGEPEPVAKYYIKSLKTQTPQNTP